MKEHRIVFFIALAFVGLSGIVFVAKQRIIESVEPAPATVASEDQVSLAREGNRLRQGSFENGWARVLHRTSLLARTL